MTAPAFTVPVVPESAPFTPEQRAWLNGFLAGMFSRGPVETAAAGLAPAARPLEPLTILFGSQTGTAESLAKRAAKAAGQRGFAATVIDMAAFTLAQLAQEKSLLVLASTHGEGEPPDNARALWTALGREDAPSLAGVRFSVCALGDTNYTHFCQCGKDFDARLEKRGAARAAPRADCEVDYEVTFARWLDAALAALAQGAAGPAAAPASAEPGDQAGGPASAAGFSRKNPFPAVLVAARTLNAAGSEKDVRHVELSLEGSGLAYEAGDALGVVPHNCPEAVGEVLAVLGCDGEEEVPRPDGGTATLRRALTELCDLGKPSDALLARLGTGGAGGTAVALHHVIDVLMARSETKLAPAEFVGLLRRLQPRLYSIASSPKAHPGSVHLTVGVVRYPAGGRPRKGVCSTFLADRVVPGESRVGVFVHRNSAFRPPPSGDAPMIMVGPGTGIAPFRAFLEERRAAGARGRNWLFFGDQREATDFLYREELEDMRSDGLLTRLDTAFSRDQAEKVYVQHRLIASAGEIFAWLEAGAHFYVCGDAARMARDVDAALHQVVERAGGRTAGEAAAYVQQLRAAKRYARDVY